MDKPRLLANQRIANAMRATRSEFRCENCGYGACGTSPPPACPMCRGTRWQIRQLR